MRNMLFDNCASRPVQSPYCECGWQLLSSLCGNGNLLEAAFDAASPTSRDQLQVLIPVAWAAIVRVSIFQNRFVHVACRHDATNLR